MQPLSFFEEGKKVIRIMNGRNQEMVIANAGVGKYLHDLQKEGAIYVAPTSRPRVHVGGSLCVSCEG